MNTKALNILLVEDNLTDANWISKILSEQSQKSNLRHVKSAEEAVDSLCKDSFDVILLDLSLADSKGIASLNPVKQKAPLLPIVVLTATDNPLLAEQSLRQGAQDYLVKGEFEGKSLIRSIRYAVERQRTEFNIRQQALMKNMLDRIRDSIDLKEILESTAKEIQEFLCTDRVLIYSCGSGQSKEMTVVAQSMELALEKLSVDRFISAINLSSLHDLLSESTSTRAVEDTFAIAELEEPLVVDRQLRSYLILPIWLSESINYIYEDLVSPMVKRTITHNQDDGLWGMLVAYNVDRTRKWHKWEISFLQKLTTQVTIAIQQSQLCDQLQNANQKLQQLAILDGLTGIANRRYFDLVLKKEWQRLAREQKPLSLILCDIDYFKAYNDSYGHQQGDLCLQHIARILKNSLKRPADLVARYGGEEFAIILPNTNYHGAIFIAQDITKQLNRARILHNKSDVSKYVTFSIGIATKVPDCHQAVSKIVKITDDLLYQAKRAGRNQIAGSNDQNIN